MARELADLGFGQAGLQQRAAHVPFARGLVTGPVIAQIIGHSAVGYRGQAQLLGQWKELAKQRLLAMVAAIRPVGGIALVGQLVGLHHDVAHADLARQPPGLFQLLVRVGLRIGGRGDAALAQHVGGDFEQQRAVHTARKSDQHRAQLAQQLLQAPVFGF